MLTLRCFNWISSCTTNSYVTVMSKNNIVLRWEVLPNKQNNISTQGLHLGKFEDRLQVCPHKDYDVNLIL